MKQQPQAKTGDIPKGSIWRYKGGGGVFVCFLSLLTFNNAPITYFTNSSSISATLLILQITALQHPGDGTSSNRGKHIPGAWHPQVLLLLLYLLRYVTFCIIIGLCYENACTKCYAPAMSRVLLSLCGYFTWFVVIIRRQEEGDIAYLYVPAPNLVENQVPGTYVQQSVPGNL